MSIFLHIAAAFPALISVNGAFAGEVSPTQVSATQASVNNKYVNAELTDKEAEKIYVAALPLAPCAGRNNAAKLLPAAMKLYLPSAEGNYPDNTSHFSIIRLPFNHYEIRVAAQYAHAFTPPVAVAQERFNAGGRDCLATVSLDAVPQLICEGTGVAMFAHALPQGINEPRLFIKNIGAAGAGAVIRVNGALDGGREYAGAVVFDGNRFNLNLNLICDKAEFENAGENINTLTLLGDIARRAAVTKYKFDAAAMRYVRGDGYAVYLCETPRKPSCNALLPYALFEAVKAGDFVEARALITDQLSEILDGNGNDLDGAQTALPSLEGFFGDYDTAAQNILIPGYEDCLLLYGKDRAVLCRFDIKEGLIDNIEII